jgi:pimeloyl-ACP methyl ester carboxylesterase
VRLTAIALLTTFVLGAAPGIAGAAAPKRRVGSVALHRCAYIGGWCGSVARPLDPSRPRGPRLDIGIRWLPASRGRARGPALVAVEGGPGGPSIASLGGFEPMYGPLLRSRALLLVDNRGTGRSGLIDCPALQAVDRQGGSAGFAGSVAKCARKLNWRYAHASDLYATAYAANDLSAVLRRLHLGRVDLYGDSYGTWFAQSFMARHPDQLHSVVLDSAYPVRGLDVWRASAGDATRNALDAVCSRDLACSSIAPGSATARLGQLLDVVRRAPIAGATRDADNSKARATVGPGTLVDLVQDAGPDPVIYRELDASVRAALAGDTVPLLRLAAQSRSFDHYRSPAWLWSAGLYFAVSCTDYPQLFDMRASPAVRRRQFAAKIGTAPDAFGPFTPEEWIRKSSWSEDYYGCLEWPRAVHRTPPLPPHPRPLPASVPILVLGGDIDTRTPLSDAKALAPTLGEKVRFVTLPNTTHVAGEGNGVRFTPTGCARRIVRSFVQAPARLGRIDTSCADAIPPIHTPGSYPRTLADAPAARLAAGPDPGERARRAATVAAGALADAAMRNFYGFYRRGPGLRGGSFRFSPGRQGRAEFQFHAVRFVSDATVAGTGSWQTSGSGRLRGDLVVRQGSGPPVRVKLKWDERTRLARATVGDSALELPAP